MRLRARNGSTYWYPQMPHLVLVEELLLVGEDLLEEDERTGFLSWQVHLL